MSKIVFNPPGLETPGYLRRTRQALVFAERMRADQTPDSIDALVEFLLPYVTEPADRDQARDALWDATQAQFIELLQAVTGANANPTPASADASAAT